MDIVQRAKNICLTPNTEWPVIASESGETGQLIGGYAAPLAAISAIAGFIGGTIIGRSVPFIGTYRVGIVAGLTGAIFTLVMALVVVFIVGLIINALAPTFGAEKSSAQALKVAVYSFTPAWLAGILQILPVFGLPSLIGLLAALYGLYLCYLGLQKVMKCPPDKAIVYTLVVVVCTFVLSAVVAMAGGLIIGGAAIGSGMMGGMSGRSSSSSGSDIKFDKDSAMGKLQALGEKLDESNKKMEAAQKSGDANAQAAAAMESLGTLLGGGKHVDPMGIDQLKPFVPDSFAGLAKKSSNAEKNGMAGIMVSKAEATYGDDSGKSVNLEITDTGGMSGMVGFASWMSMAEEKDNEYSSERTRKVDGRFVHEKVSKQTGGQNEYEVVLGDRFMVGAKGNLPIDQLKSGLAGLDLAKLEAMKNVGVK